jgi:hypothetical protein
MQKVVTASQRVKQCLDLEHCMHWEPLTHLLCAQPHRQPIALLAIQRRPGSTSCATILPPSWCWCWFLVLLVLVLVA